MNTGYTIETDKARGRMTLTLSGFFSEDDVALFTKERTAAQAALRCAPNQHLTLCDVSGCRLQSAAVVEAFTRIIGDPRAMSRRIAFVVGSSLARMQVRRMLVRDNAACFEDRASAEAWLHEDDTAAVPRINSPAARATPPAI